MDEQLPFAGPPKGECEGRRDVCNADGCPKFGTLLRPSRDGKQRIRGCGDPVARGKRNKRKGGRKQAAAARAVGVPRSNLSPGHEEHFGGAIRVEVKSGKQIAPAWTRFENARIQSEAARPIGDNRPFAALFMPDGTSDGLFACALSDLQEVVYALLENFERLQAIEKTL